MTSSQKPWEVDLAEDDASGKAEHAGQGKETDPLLPGKQSPTLLFGLPCDVTFGMKGFLEDLADHFGCKLLIFLFTVQFLLKGYAHEIIRKAIPYTFKSYHVPASLSQIYSGVISLPWAMKPIVGLASDACPIYGYNKAPYMLSSSVVGVCALFFVGLMPNDSLSVGTIVLCMGLSSLQLSTADLLSEAKYAEKMREVPSRGTALMTYVWFGMQFFSLLAVIMSGVLITRFGSKVLYISAGLAATTVLIPTALNYMEEEKLTHSQVQERWKKFSSQNESVFLCFLMLAATLVLSGFGFFGTPRQTCIAALVIAFVILASFSVLLSPVIAKFNAFSLIQTSLSVSVSGASFYFYTDNPEQYPDGPHFSPFFYNSVVGVVSAIFSLIGIFYYQRYMSKWNYRRILLFTNFGYSLLCLPDIVLFTRFNKTLGVPDHAFMLGSTILQNVIYQWQWMPQVVILSFLCPKGMEATMYALLAGCHNLGNTIAANFGALLLERLGCLPSGLPDESAQFEKLWVASALSTALPFVTIVLLFWLIPDARQDEKLIGDDANDATSGSLWRRWTQGKADGPQP